jgi:hypothetical protein
MQIDLNQTIKDLFCLGQTASVRFGRVRKGNRIPAGALSFPFNYA